MYIHQQSDYLFKQLNQQLKYQLNQLQIEAQCLLYQRLKIDFQENNNSENQKVQQQQQNRYIKIQIRGDYVLQLNYVTNQILSAFQCDISITFKLLRTNCIQLQTVGQIIGIQFRSLNFIKKNYFLYLPQKEKNKHLNNLNNLTDKLGRKYIFQDGFHQLYRAVKKIGKGVTASVYKALRLTDQKQVAVKSFKKQQYYEIDNGRGKIAFLKQFKAMTIVQSKYLCQLYSVYESQNSIYIVMELLTKSLYSFLKLNGFPQLNLAKQIMVKLLLGLGQMHKKNLIHRDLKLQNIMILQTQINIQPVIIDFGLAQNPNNSQFLYVKCGTPGYVAPQILNLKSNMLPSPPYTNKCDIFSLGVIFFILLAGKTVFEGDQQRQVVKKNRQCLIDYQFKNHPKLNSSMKDLLRKMLQKNPEQRPSIDQILNHQFFQEVQILKEFRTTKTGLEIEIQQK